ncbi:MAG: beta-lactamase family protein, partial [Christensenellaceae bacterium]|nr:beta-lactamase family protein [Christensenellaceae bacterium]
MTEFKRYAPEIGTPLPRIRPESAGVHPAAISRMIRSYAEKGLRIHSFLLVRDGKVYSEGYYAPYEPNLFQTVYSLSKSFTSVAMGIAEGEGILSLDEKIEDIFAEEIRAAGTKPSKELSSLTVRNLLRMGTGQERENWSGTDHVLSFLKEPFHEMPGEYFRYNTSATYMCAATLWKKGVDLEAYLQEKLFGPLGISGAHWQRCLRGICTGGYGLSVLPEIIAKFGVLILNDGVFEGKQIIPKAYLDQAATKQISNAHHSPNLDWQAGYGYQFWMCQNGSFRGDGMYGQL